MTKALIGIIGGSGIYDLPGLQDLREEKIATPWGEPSDAVRFGRIGGTDAVFLPRHGRGHRLSPSGINYRANIDALKRVGVTDIVSVATDSPFLPSDLVVRLQQARTDSGMPLACAQSGDRTQPPFGLWPVSLRDDLRQALLVEGLRKIDLWTARHGIATAIWPQTPYDPFFNANRPDDLDDAERIYRNLA
jgi:hypothetical protein